MEHEKLIRTVTAAQAGDGEAMNELFNAYYNDVYYFALKTVKDEELACDITQETFVEIINTLGNLQAPGAFVTWMKQIAYHQCTRYFKKKKDILVDEDEDGNTVFDTLKEERTEFIPDEAMDQADFRRTILAMIDELSEEQRSAVMMLYFDELSVKQIAEIQGVSEGTVKSRLNYARKAIRSSVEAYEKKNGIKLHSVAILPLLLWLFQDSAAAMPAASAAAVAQGVTAATGTAVAVSAGTAAATAAAATATAVTVTAAKATVPLAVKIAAGFVAASVAVGGAAVGISTLTDKDPTEPTESYVTEAPAQFVVEENCIYIDADGIVYEAGSPMPAPRRGDEYRTPDYTYRLGQSLTRRVVDNPDLPPWEMGWAGAQEIEFYWADMPLLGWGASCNDNKLMTAPALDAIVNGLPLTYLGCAYFSCEHLTETPEIPDTVTDLRQAFFGCDNLERVTNFPSALEDLSLAFTHCRRLTEVPALPAGVKNMFAAFAYCYALPIAPDIPAAVQNMAQCFEGCSALTGTIKINAQLFAPTECNFACDICRDYDYGCRLCFVCDSTAMCFENTVQPIVLLGDCPYLARLAASSSNGNVTVLGAPTEEEPSGWVIPTGCTYTRGDTVYTAGQIIDFTCEEGDQFNDGTYLYTYTDGICYPTEALEHMYIIISWNPVVIDTTATSYAPIATSINAEPVRMMKETFKNCYNMTASPKIPDTVVFMSDTYRNCRSMTAAPAIPAVTDYMAYVFAGCSSLTIPSAFPENAVVLTGAYMDTAITYAPAIPASAIIAPYVFKGCQTLTGDVEIHSQLISDGFGDNALLLFDNTALPITLTGSSTQLAEIAAKYENVTVK